MYRCSPSPSMSPCWLMSSVIAFLYLFLSALNSLFSSALNSITFSSVLFFCFPSSQHSISLYAIQFSSALLFVSSLLTLLLTFLLATLTCIDLLSRWTCLILLLSKELFSLSQMLNCYHHFSSDKSIKNNSLITVVLSRLIPSNWPFVKPCSFSYCCYACKPSRSCTTHNDSFTNLSSWYFYNNRCFISDKSRQKQ